MRLVTVITILNNKKKIVLKAIKNVNKVELKMEKQITDD